MYQVVIAARLRTAPRSCRCGPLQEMHEEQEARIERLSNVGRPQAKHGHLRLRIVGCKGLKAGGVGDRLPDPFVVAQFIEACEGWVW